MNVGCSIFVELVRKNAFITRVAVEVGWVALLWVMHLCELSHGVERFSCAE